MQNNPDKILIESVKRLLRRDATTRLRKIARKTHAADLSSVFHSLSIPNQRRLFDLIDEIEIKGEIFSNVDKDTFLNLIEEMTLDEMVEILDLMPKDDVADLLGHLPVEKSDAVLEMMKKEGSEEVEGLLHYGDDTAGGIMVPDFIALREDTTARAAIESLQEEHLDVEMPFYLYVVDSNGKLIGVSSLRQLVVVPPNTVAGRSADGKILPEFLVERVGVPQQNYSWGGAQAGTDNIVGALFGAPDTVKTGTLSQIDEFEAFLGSNVAPKNALYLVFAGSNDLFFADKNDQAAVDAAVASADASLRTAVTRLSDLGARNIVVATRTPRPVLSDAATVSAEPDPDARNDASGRQLSTSIAALVGDLDTTLSADVLLFDAYEIIREIIAGAGTNGFDAYSDASTDYCNPPGGPQRADCSTLINFDGAHKTSAVHSVLADRFIQQFSLQTTPAPVPLPPSLSLMLGGIAALGLYRRHARKAA